MSRADVISGAVAVILAGVAYFISGPKLAFGAIAVGLIILAAVHLLSKEKPKAVAPSSENAASTASLTVNPIINVNPTIAPVFNNAPTIQPMVVLAALKRPQIHVEYKTPSHIVAGALPRRIAFINAGEEKAYAVDVLGDNSSGFQLCIRKPIASIEVSPNPAFPDLYVLHDGQEYEMESDLLIVAMTVHDQVPTLKFAVRYTNFLSKNSFAELWKLSLMETGHWPGKLECLGEFNGAF